MKISLIPMTDDMYYIYFKEYENDPDLYLDKDKYKPYEYSVEAVSRYIERKKAKKQIPMAILCDNEMIGELIFKEIIPGESVTIGISLKQAKYKDHGYGTEAEKLAVDYAFKKFGVKTVLADTILTNTRSQHVLEKVGFVETSRDDIFIYYELQKTSFLRRRYEAFSNKFQIETEMKTMIDVTKLIHEFCEQNQLCICFSADMPEGYETANGTFDITKNTLFFNTAMLAEAPEYEMLFYLFHELRHVLQYVKPEQFSPIIQESLSYVLMYDGTCYKLINGEWAECRLEGTEEYLTKAYLGQPYELDANQFAYERVKAILEPSEDLDKLYAFWTPQAKLSDTEYRKIYHEIDMKLQSVQDSLVYTD